MVACGDVVPGTAVGVGVTGGTGCVHPERQSMTATTERAAVKRSLFMEEHHGRSYKSIATGIVPWEIYFREYTTFQK
jgi:hypothetical protein